jgi:hypothetical protein
MSFTFRSVCFLFLSICCVHISLESKCKPRYFAVGDCGITVLFMCTAGHCYFLSVKVTCIDLVKLMLICHFFSQASSWSRWPCSLCEAVTGSSTFECVRKIPFQKICLVVALCNSLMKICESSQNLTEGMLSPGM